MGLPVAYALAFQAEWGVQGLWAGVVVVNTLLALTMAVVTARTDFRLEAAKAGERAGWLVAPLLARSENAGRMDAISEHDEN